MKEKLFEQLVREYTGEMLRWTMSRTGNRAASEDIVQEAFMGVWKSLDRFNNQSGVKTWVFRILNNKIADYHRSRFREQTLYNNAETTNDIGSLDFFDVSGSWNSSQTPLSWLSDENVVENKEFTDVVYRCMDKLPVKARVVFEMKFVDEKKTEEICQVLGITPTNLWQLMHRGKLQLRSCLEVNWFKK